MGSGFDDCMDDYSDKKKKDAKKRRLASPNYMKQLNEIEKRYIYDVVCIYHPDIENRIRIVDKIYSKRIQKLSVDEIVNIICDYRMYNRSSTRFMVFCAETLQYKKQKYLKRVEKLNKQY